MHELSYMRQVSNTKFMYPVDFLILIMINI